MVVPPTSLEGGLVHLSSVLQPTKNEVAGGSSDVTGHCVLSWQGLPGVVGVDVLHFFRNPCVLNRSHAASLLQASRSTSSVHPPVPGPFTHSGTDATSAPLPALSWFTLMYEPFLCFREIRKVLFVRSYDSIMVLRSWLSVNMHAKHHVGLDLEMRYWCRCSASSNRQMEADCTFLALQQWLRV